MDMEPDILRTSSATARSFLSGFLAMSFSKKFTLEHEQCYFSTRHVGGRVIVLRKASWHMSGRRWEEPSGIIWAANI